MAQVEMAHAARYLIGFVIGKTARGWEMSPAPGYPAMTRGFRMLPFGRMAELPGALSSKQDASAWEAPWVSKRQRRMPRRSINDL